MPVLLAPAKINVTLEILTRRDDGYHTLRSVMLPIGLYDRITLEPSTARAGSFVVDDAALAHDNLVTRALAACGLANAYDVRLEKVVPVGGGLGGGSSDAAAILRSAMAGELGAMTSVDWNATARSLGSDVPFFLIGTGALVEGTGERVTPIGALPPWWVVVVRPHASVPTAHAYRLLASLRERDGAPPTRVRAESVSLGAIDALQRADFAGVESFTRKRFSRTDSRGVPGGRDGDGGTRARGRAAPTAFGIGIVRVRPVRKRARGENRARCVRPRGCKCDVRRAVAPRYGLARMIDVVVLAGGPKDDLSASTPGAPNKAFVSIAGSTLVERTLGALRSSWRVGRIVAVVPEDARTSPALGLADETRAAGETMTESLRNGLHGLDPDRQVLVAASDLPILSRDAIDEFLDFTTLSDADIVYACVERGIHEARFPEVPHTWATLADGTFCGGGLVALRPRVLPALEGLLGRLGTARKNPLALAAIFGPRVLARYAVGRLRIAHAERRASELVGARVVAARSTHPEIAVNVDRISDIALAERLVTSSA